MTAAAYHNSDTEGFVMDDLGNRDGNQTLRGEGTVNYAVDPLTNRYTAIAGHPLAYDAAGNLTQDKDGYGYVYDYENRITRIYEDNNSDGSYNTGDTNIAEYAYDTQGRRIRVYDAVTTAETRYYYSDNWQVLAEYNGSGVQQAYYIFGNYIDEVLLMNRGGSDKYYLHDHLYSPAALLDNSGNVIERYEYDAYGKVHILAPNYEPRTTSLYGNPYFFTGREVDWFNNGNLTLQHNRHRPYSQFMGCWFTPDPWGYVDGLNLYEYTNSNPTFYMDAYGLYATGISIGNYVIMSSSSSSEQTPLNSKRQQTVIDSYNEYSTKVMLREEADYIKMQVGSVIEKWKAEYPNASEFLAYYAANNQPRPGTIIGGLDVGQYMSVKPLNYALMIKQSSHAKNHVKGQIMSVIATVNENRILTRGYSIMTASEDSSSVPIGLGHGDWLRVIHGYGTWHKAVDITCSYGRVKAKFTSYLRDVYDFAFSPPLHDALFGSDFGFAIRPSDLKNMHLAGEYREFFVTGEASTTIMWKLGKNSYEGGF